MKTIPWIAAASVLAFAACNASGPSAKPPGMDPDPKVNPDPDPNPDPKVDPPGPIPTFPVGTNPVGTAKDCEVDLLSPASVYGNKVKTLLTGMPLTDVELAALKDDPEALSPMVEGWFADPRADVVLTRFFRMAFQQDQVTGEGIMPMLKQNNINWGRFDDTRERVADLMLQNIEESFSRTALKMVREGRPFNEVVTTDTFEMTTALMVFYAYLDHRHVNDQDQFFTRPMDEVTSFVGLRNQAQEAPPSEVLDPNSPSFMRMWLPGFDELCVDASENEMPFGPNAIANKVQFVFLALLGRMDNVRNVPANQGQAGNPCRARPRTRQPLLSEADFSDWRPVRVRKVAQGETPIRFYRLDRLRAANELALFGERVGFFTTLGFFGTWPTNEDNSARVTLNQTLITALGASFDGTTVTDFSPPNLDEEHSAPGSACYGCHQTLDPMRNFFRQSYSSAYGEQHDEERIGLESIFVFRGVQATGNGVRGLADIIATHPDFAEAWVQKLCHFANAAACPESDELEAVVSRFSETSFDFEKMAVALFSSPLVTDASCVNERTGRGPSISRRDQFCVQLSNRLGVDDICALDTPPRRRSQLQKLMVNAVSSVPADTVSRGEVEPITISETGLFTRATREVVCNLVGERAFDGAFANMGRRPAVEKMVTEVMGLPAGDPRHEGAITILMDHVTDGVAAGANQRDALRSALAVACMSPGVAGIGF